MSNKSFCLVKMLIRILTYSLFANVNAVSQTIENPVFDRTFSHAIHVDKIELLKDSTCVYCSLTPPDDLWANISPQTYIEDVYSKRKFTILRSEGVPFSPQIRNLDKGKKYELKFIFPALPPTSEIDLVENQGGPGFNVYGISLTNSLKNVFEPSEYNRISNMANFWASSGDSVKAIDYKKKEIEISKYLFGRKSILYIMGLYDLSDLYNSFGDLKGSVYWKENATKISMDISRRLIKKQTIQHEKDYYLQAIDIFYGMQGAACKYFMEKKRWKEAKEIISNTYELIKEKNDTSIYIPLAEYFIGCSSYFSKDEDSAEKYYILSYDSFQKHSEAKTLPTYAELLNMMSMLYHTKGDNSKAYQFAREACDATRNISGDKSKEYGFALAALSNAEMSLNMKEIGLSHAEQASEIIEKADDVPYEIKEIYRERIPTIKNLVSGANNNHSKDTEYSSDNIPVVIIESYNDVHANNWNVAIEKLYKAKEYQEHNFNKTFFHNYVQTVVSLSDVLAQSGRLIEANAVLDTAIVVVQKNEVKSNMIRHIYASKGLLYYMLNDTKSAIWWYNQALDLFRQVDDRSISYARLLGNISLLYTNAGSYEKAVSLLDEAMGICDGFYTNDMENSTDYYTIMNNIATNYVKMGDYNKGKEVYNTIISHVTSQNSLRTKALAMCNLAEIYIFTDEIQKAIQLLEEANSLQVDGYIKEMIVNDYIYCLLIRKDSAAIDKIEALNNITKENVTKIFGSFSEAEREKYWNQSSGIMIILNNMALSTFDTDKTKQMAYNTALFTKSMVINSGRLLESIVKRSDDYSKKQYATMQQYKEELVNKGLPADSVNSYIRKISQLEKKIVSEIPDFSEKLNAQFKTFIDVKNSLSDNEFAVEFVFMPLVKFPIAESQLLYGALILSKQDIFPKFVTLCSEEALKSILCIEDTTRQYDPNIVYSSINDSLYQLIWAPIEPYIKEGSTIYYSPTGLINRINLSAISDGTKRLAEKYELYEVSTTANIKETGRDPITPSGNAIIYGDVNYDEDIETMETIAQEFQSYSPGLLLAKRSLIRGTWDLLPGTKEEIELISNIIKKKGVSVSVYRMNKANEESFKSLNGKSIDIIHIATHGFYFQDKKSNQTNFFNNLGSYTYGDRSMQYSGLLFSGANNAWTGKPIKGGVEDGILTAEEISRIDLSNTNLVVLSACDTGLGDIDKINGVLGLQRGFKRAGVESVLMSLWKVDDEATKILMVEFYKNLTNGKTKHQSLKDAQKYLRQVDNGKYNKPEYWASFIMLDGLY